MTDKSAAAIRELAEHWMPMVRYKDKSRFIECLTALIEEHFVSKEEVNQEVERRIAERMPSEEDIEKAFTTEHYHWEQGRHYKVRKDRIFGAKWLRSRLTNPGDSQKTEGGGE